MPDNTKEKMIQRLTRLLLPMLLLIVLNPSGCSDTDNDEQPLDVLQNNYQEQGDLPAIREHGKLRILVNRNSDRALPRDGSPLYMEQQLAAAFARRMQLQPMLVYVDSFDQLIDALQQGRGDLIAANLTITEQRKQQIDFTVPVGQARQQLVSRQDDNSIEGIDQLKNRRIAVRPGTTHQQTLQRLQQKLPIQAQLLSGNLDVDDILDRLASRQIDLAILDSNLLQQAAEYRQDFRVALDLSEQQPLAWGLRKHSPELQDALNRFLNQQAFGRNQQQLFSGDLDAIKQRKTLRLLTRNNGASYFLWRGELLGFEYELARAFAEKHQLRLEVVVAPSHEQLIPMLKAGKGDLIAAFMTVTEARKQQDIAFSRPHHYASEILVTRASDLQLESPQDLQGRSVHVRRSSAYWNSLRQLQQQGINFKLVAAPETMETEELIARVADGDMDLTVADSHILDIELTWRNDIRGAFSLGEQRDNAWVVRAQNSQLLAAINNFIRQEYRGLFYNITYEKYFQDARRIKSHRDERIDLNADGSISPYDPLAKKYARQYGFDWRLLVAQMYQESRFDPQAKSWVGARGLMQVMPRTAKEMQLTALQDPETGLHAGVKYLDWVRDRFEPELDVKARMWFTLAAYNAGQGHVKDARRLARQKGWDPNRWFNHVEKAMLLLAKRQYARHARHGYVRGREPVAYVRDIRNRFIAYQRLAEQQF